MKKVLCGSLMSMFCFVAAAEDPINYVGAGIGESSAEDVFFVGDQHEDTSFQIKFGSTLTPYSSLELDISFLGEAKISAPGASAAIDVMSLPIILSVHSHIDAPVIAELFAGFHYWTADITASSPYISADLTEDGVDPTYGLGLGLRVNEQATVMFRWQNYELEDFEIETLSVNLHLYYDRPRAQSKGQNEAAPSSSKSWFAPKEEDPRWKHDPDPWRKYDEYSPTR